MKDGLGFGILVIGICLLFGIWDLALIDIWFYTILLTMQLSRGT
jgi:hypothetical protein